MIFWALISVFLLAIFEATFLNFPITLLTVSFLSLVVLDFTRLFWLAFLAGFFYDLWSSQVVGRTSLIFLAVSMVAFFYRRKFVTTHLIFEVVFFSCCYKLWQVVDKESFNLQKLMFFLGLGVLIIFWLKRVGFTGGSKSDEKFLISSTKD